MSTLHAKYTYQTTTIVNQQANSSTHNQPSTETDGYVTIEYFRIGI